MSSGAPVRWFGVALLWLFLIAIAGGGYMLIVQPYLNDKHVYSEYRAQYVKLAADAQLRGFANVPKLDESDSGARHQAAVDALRVLLTGGVTITEPITIAMDSFSGYAILRTDAFRNELANQGLKLKLADDGADYAKRLLALRDGRVQMATFPIDAYIKASAELGESPATIVFVIDETVGADAMVAYAAGIPTIDALNSPDTMFVVTPNSPSETLARVVMASFELPKLRVDPFVRASGAAEVLAALKKSKPNEKKAFILWEPYVTQALRVPGTHVLLDSGDFRGYIVDVIVARREFVLEHPERIRSVCEGYFRAAYQVRQQTGGFKSLVEVDSKALGLSLTPEQSEHLVNGVWWKNTTENYAHFGLQSGAPSSGTRGNVSRIEDSIRAIVSVLLRTGGITRDPTQGNPASIVYSAALKGMLESGFHPAGLIGQAASPEAMRSIGELQALTPAAWDTLAPVGRLQVERIVFARGTGTLTEHGKLALDRLADVLASFPRYYVTIRGSARSDGDAEANRALAELRANAAAGYLKSKGIEVIRLRVVAASPETGLAGTSGEAQTVTFTVGQVPF